jgi:hypothetical protein
MRPSVVPAPKGVSRPDLLLVSDFKVALRRPGCPLCRLLRESDHRYLKVFLREGKDDGRMLLRLLGSWGLCARHAAALVRLEPVERGDGLGTATLYDWLLDQARRRLDDLRRDLDADGFAGSPLRGNRRNSRNRKRIHKLISRLARKAPCPACESQRQYVPYTTEAFVRALEPAAGLPQIREMYLVSDGLCIPHWQAVRELPASGEVHAFVAAKQRDILAALKAALDGELKRGIADPASGEEESEIPGYSRILDAVAGDTTWSPPEGGPA